jgi:hypothetical protein
LQYPKPGVGRLSSLNENWLDSRLFYCHFYCYGGELRKMNTQPVDHSALKTNQAVIIILLVLAFILNQPWIAGLVGLVMLTGTAFRQPGFGWLYKRILRPSGLVRPDVIQDHPEPHRFAQGFGGVVVLAGFLALLAGYSTFGWALAWLVVALAALNLFAGFCVGCAVYYQLNRLNLPGFAKSAPEGIIPGLRPRRNDS